MIMAMSTAPAMMPAPTMKVMPEKIRGTCATHTPAQHHAGEREGGLSWCSCCAVLWLKLKRHMP